MSSRIAAHVGDMIKLGKRDKDLAMGHARRDLDWETQYNLSINPDRARQIRSERAPADNEACTMCGDYCALKIANKVIKKLD